MPLYTFLIITRYEKAARKCGDMKKACQRLFKPLIRFFFIVRLSESRRNLKGKRRKAQKKAHKKTLAKQVKSLICQRFSLTENVFSDKFWWR